MEIVTIDFETYYTQEYSLSKLTTEEYVRDPRFEVICVAVKVGDNETDCFSGTLQETRTFLQGLDYSHRAILCHNTAFDGAILSWLFGIKPRLWLDTLSMARPLHNVRVGGSLKALAAHYDLGVKGSEVVNAIGKRRCDFTPQELAAYSSYCINDVELTYRLFKKLCRGFPPAEIQAIDQTLRMFTEPLVELDTDVLVQYLDTLQTNKQKLLEDTGLAGLGEERLKKLLMSNSKFARLLTLLGVTPPTKISARTGKEAYAFAKTDTEFTALLDHPSQTVQTLVAARLGHRSTIAETRTERLISAADRGALPVLLNYYGAHTGRFSGGDKLNLQNFPRGGALRSALTAPDSHTLIACDLSQIEARITAWLARQNDLVEAFREGRDVYSEFATEIYKFKVTKQSHPKERFVGKVGILGLGYSMGGERFKATLETGAAGDVVEISQKDAQNIVRIYRQKNFQIVALWQKASYALNQMFRGKAGTINQYIAYDAEGFMLPNGLRLRYAGLRTSTTNGGLEYIANSRNWRKLERGETPEYTKIYGGKVVENLVQALAQVVIKEHMVALGARYRIVFQVHDEIVFCVPTEQADEAQQIISTVMSTPPTWAASLPVACEVGVGANYGECK